MRMIQGLTAALVAVGTMLGPALSARAQPTVVPLTKPLRLASPVHPAKGATAIYIVKLKNPGAASYKAASARVGGASKPGS